MRYKVGDRVRFIGSLSHKLMGLTGKIMNYTGYEAGLCPYRMKWDKTPKGYMLWMAVYDNEIEKVNAKGKQLEFSFME